MTTSDGGADRSWATRSQLELAVVEYIGWFNHDRLHSALGYITPTEHEALYARWYEPMTGTRRKENLQIQSP